VTDAVGKNTHPSPADLRAEIARCQILRYELAPLVGLNASRLGQLLNERAPMSSAVALRIQDAITQYTNSKSRA